MGMYDTIIFNCPNCGTEIEVQSKSGECILGVYESTDVPIPVAQDANRHAPFECLKCHKKWYFDISGMPPLTRINLPIKEC